MVDVGFQRVLTSYSLQFWSEKLISQFSMNPNLVHLVEDFLTDRRQFVTYHFIMSHALPVRVGAPHGSILGPLL